MDAGNALDVAITYLTGAFPYTAEFQNVGIALEGAVAVRKGPNKQGKLHWFHAFMLSVVAAFGGGIFNFIWLGKPSGIIANDMNIASCMIAFAVINLIPMGFGFMLCDSLPVAILIKSAAQLFRSLGLVKFLKAAFVMFKDSPSDYYPIPVFGPIIYATLLGNMGAFVLKGFEQHVGNGVPWGFQNGIFCASFYHFYVHDEKGPIGNMLRSAVPLASMMGLDDATFATAFVSLFALVTGILQMPEFLGPKFTPFGADLLSPFYDPTTWSVGKEETEFSKKQAEIGAAKKNDDAAPATAVAVPRELNAAAFAAAGTDANGEDDEELSVALSTTESTTGTGTKKKRKRKKKKSGANANANKEIKAD